jgi:hypothetical protein
LRPYIQLIEVTSEYIRSRKLAHNITYFPEFDLKNVGIRRAKGEYILSGNCDSIPPVGFFEAVQKRAFSALSYIRSKRVLANYSLHDDMVAHWFSVQLSKYENQQFVDVCANRYYYDAYERDGCGDFQGAHRKMWYIIHGFLETEHVFHVDTGVSLDFSAFPSFIYARTIGVNVHLRHPKESKLTSHFKFYEETIKNWIRQGIMTHMTEQYSRPDWGGKEVEFQTY